MDVVHLERNSPWRQKSSIDEIEVITSDDWEIRPKSIRTDTYSGRFLSPLFMYLLRTTQGE